MCILPHRCIQCSQCPKTRWVQLPHYFEPCALDYLSAPADASCPDFHSTRIVKPESKSEVCTQCTALSKKKKATTRRIDELMLNGWAYEDRVRQTKIKLEQLLLRLRYWDDGCSVFGDNGQDEGGGRSLWGDVLERYEEQHASGEGDDVESMDGIESLDEGEIECGNGYRVQQLKMKLKLV